MVFSEKCVKYKKLKYNCLLIILSKLNKNIITINVPTEFNSYKNIQNNVYQL